MNIETAQFLEKERREASKFIGEKYFSGREAYSSPSGRFRIDLEKYTDEGINEEGLPYDHRYQRVRIFEGNTLIKELISHLFFFFEWIEKGGDRNYLLCSEYYQGYGVLDLHAGTYRFYLPDEAVEGDGFNWAKGYLSPSKNRLAIEGCVWASPYQIKIFDLGDLFSLPYRCLFETTTEMEYREALGWIGEDEFEYTDEENNTVRIKVG